MSTKRALQVSKWKQSLGMGAGSVDAEVEAAAHTLEELEDRVRDMKAALAGAAAAAEASARAFRGATQAVVAMASRDAPAFDHFRATDAASDTGHVAVAGRLCAMWNRVVVGKADAWLADLAGVKELLVRHAEDKLRFDHYTDKVAGLREERRKRHEKGKADGKKAMEKLQRNEDKLAEATRVYQNSRTDVLQSVRGAVARKHDHLDNVLLRLMQYEVHSAKEASVYTQPLQAIAAELTQDLKDRGLLNATTGSGAAATSKAQDSAGSGTGKTDGAATGAGAVGGAPASAATPASDVPPPSSLPTSAAPSATAAAPAAAATATAAGAGVRRVSLGNPFRDDFDDKSGGAKPAAAATTTAAAFGSGGGALAALKPPRSAERTRRRTMGASSPMSPAGSTASAAAALDFSALHRASEPAVPASAAAAGGGDPFHSAPGLPHSGKDAFGVNPPTSQPFASVAGAPAATGGGGDWASFTPAPAPAAAAKAGDVGDWAAFGGGAVAQGPSVVSATAAPSASEDWAAFDTAAKTAAPAGAPAAGFGVGAAHTAAAAGAQGSSGADPFAGLDAGALMMSAPASQPAPAAPATGMGASPFGGPLGAAPGAAASPPPAPAHATTHVESPATAAKNPFDDIF